VQCRIRIVAFIAAMILGIIAAPVISGGSL
jgi:hypothetical protein